MSANPKFTLILFSGDFDKVMAALTLANSAAGRNLDVTIFFTFWGMTLLREKNLPTENTLENMFKTMMPEGVEAIGLSKMNFLGLGSQLLKKLIHEKDGQTASDLFEMAMERKIRFIACEASLKLLGITPAELIKYEHLEIGGVDDFWNHALDSQTTLFI